MPSSPATPRIPEGIVIGRALVALVGSALLLGLAACTAEIPTAGATGEGAQATKQDDAEDAGDEGDVWDDDATATTHTIARGSSGCATSRSTLLANASGDRREVLERGFTWFDAKVPYSQSRSRGGFRTDCSGFVSMAWQLSRSFTTASFANGTAENSKLSSFSSLQPGDALVRRSGGAGHIVLFLGWDDDDQSSACVLEQASTALDMQFRPRSASSLKSGGYKPVRSDNL